MREARLHFGLRAGRAAWRMVGLLPELTDQFGDDARSLPAAVIAQLHKSVADWMGVRTVGDPGHRERPQRLYDDYIGWARAAGFDGDDIVTATVFGRLLSSCGVGAIQSGQRFRVGLRLLE